MARRRYLDQPRVRSHVARLAWDATGGGKHGGTSRQQRRKDRQITKQELKRGEHHD